MLRFFFIPLLPINHNPCHKNSKNIVQQLYTTALIVVVFGYIFYSLEAYGNIIEAGEEPARVLRLL